MAEIGNTRPAHAPQPVARPAASQSGIDLQLTQPLAGLKAGQTLSAQVLASRQQGVEHAVTLKLTLNTQTSTVTAKSVQSLASGTQLSAKALSAERLIAHLSAAPTALKSLDLSQLPQGSQLQLKVLTQMGQTISAQVQNGPLAGQLLSLESTLKLAAGSLLTVKVLGAQQLLLIPLNQRLEQLSLLSQLNGQWAKQGSLQALLTSLSQFAPSDALKLTLDKLMASISDVSKLSSAQGAAQALANSGAFMEARLLAGLGVEQDLKANMLRLISQLQTGAPAATAALNPAAMGQALPALLRDALGRLAPKTQALQFPLPNRVLQNLDQAPDLQMLLKLAAGALARVQTQQLASLLNTTDATTTQQSWQMEIPMRHEQQISTLQVKIGQEQPAQKEASKGHARWSIELAFDIAPLGPLQIKAALSQNSLSAQLFAERPDTCQLINQELDVLRARLDQQGVTVGELNCQLGVPAQGLRTAISYHWVDERV